MSRPVHHDTVLHDTVLHDTALVDNLDEWTRAIYLEVPSAKIVLFQAYFELFEGLGIVRTLSVRRSLVCVLTTRDCLQDCFRVLSALRPEIPWRQVARPEEAVQQLYLGYFGKQPAVRRENDDPSNHS